MGKIFLFQQLVVLHFVIAVARKQITVCQIEDSFALGHLKNFFEEVPSLDPLYRSE